MRVLILFLFFLFFSAVFARFKEQVSCDLHIGRVADQLTTCFAENEVDSCETLTVTLYNDFNLRTFLLGDFADKVVIKGRGNLLEGSGMILSKRLQSVTFNNVGFTGAETPIFASSDLCTSMSFEGCTFSGFSNTAIINLIATCSVVDVSFKNVLFLMNTNASMVLHGVRSCDKKHLHNEQQIAWHVALREKTEL